MGADKDNKYFIESYYLQKQKQHKENVRDMYNEYLLSLGKIKLTSANKLAELKELFHSYVQRIVHQLDVPKSPDKLSLNTTVLTALNMFYAHHEQQHSKGELENLTNYKDRTTKLKEFFCLECNKFLKIRDLNVGI